MYAVLEPSTLYTQIKQKGLQVQNSAPYIHNPTFRFNLRK